MADKRKFYNTGDAKGFTKAVYYNEVLKLATGDEVADDMVALIIAATEYELEGIAARTSAAAAGEKKNPLNSDYANALRDAILPLIDGTPRTVPELVDAATAKGKVWSGSGKPFASTWVSRVLNNTDGVTAVKKIIETVDSKGLKAQREVTAYKKG